jgi:poly [ADP-ribose] polymerase
MANLIKEVRLIFAENGTDPKTGKLLNSYKYWESKLYDDGNWTAEWGRVGCENPDSGTWNESNKTLDSVVRSKIKKGYSHQKTMGEAVAQSGSGTVVKNTDLHAIARAQLLKSSSPVLDRLIKRFVDANVHKITSSTQITYNSTTGLFTTPLGIVTMEGLTDARDLLAKLAPKVRSRKFGADADALLCQYLRIIPQSLGMKRYTTETVIPDDNAIQKQNDLIDSLESSYQATLVAPAPKAGAPVKAQEQVFKVDLDVLADASERRRLEQFFENSKKHQHGYDNVRVREIFRVTIHDMANAFETKTTPVKEVFHGTSQANCLSILKSGLKVSPPSTAAIAGKMWGNGVYGAINSTKSLGYTFNRWGQGGVGDAGWLFICDFAMGKIDYPRYTCSRPAAGHDSIWATASNTGLNNDELIVFRNSQCNIRYLLECK